MGKYFCNRCGKELPEEDMGRYNSETGKKIFLPGNCKTQSCIQYIEENNKPDTVHHFTVLTVCDIILITLFIISGCVDKGGGTGIIGFLIFIILFNVFIWKSLIISDSGGFDL